MRSILLTILLFITSGFAFSAAEKTTANPEDVVRQFYEWRIKSSTSGAPNMTELNAMRPSLTKELICLLEQAQLYRNAYTKKFPQDKPPFEEGDLYSSTFEGPTRYEIAQTKIDNNQAHIQLHFYLDDRGTLDKKGWHDMIRLTKIKDQWQIYDIEYQAEFDFRNSGSLRTNLYEAMSKNEPEIKWRANKVRACGKR